MYFISLFHEANKCKCRVQYLVIFELFTKSNSARFGSEPLLSVSVCVIYLLNDTHSNNIRSP